MRDAGYALDDLSGNWVAITAEETKEEEAEVEEG